MLLASQFSYLSAPFLDSHMRQALHCFESTAASKHFPEDIAVTIAFKEA